MKTATRTAINAGAWARREAAASAFYSNVVNNSSKQVPTCLRIVDALEFPPMSPEIRNRILGAAARVYAQYGFRGATTRLIAAEAGVNEVTLFRIFGSKALLLQAMLQSQVAATAVPMLSPEDVSDPQREITNWCAITLEYLRGHAHLIRKTIAEAEERPDAACAACEGPNSASESLVLYLEHLREAGMADPEADVGTAVSMLMSAMFGDALYR